VKLVTYRTSDSAGVGVLADGAIIPSRHSDMIALISADDLALDHEVRIRHFTLGAPIARPGKILGSGINYLSHKEENPDAVLPEYPGFFSKFATSVIGPDEPIRLPYPDSHTDYEVELAVVIGLPGKDIDARDSARHIFGYTVVNDVSERLIQFSNNRVDLGKSCDSFCPMGPAIVTADEVPDPSQLVVRSFVNGELRQSASTSTMLFSVFELVAAASRHITLEAGDVIATGTPAGCGTFRRPPVWLQPGDDVVVEVVGLGALRNAVLSSW
jgi:2,4-diketo-3-deoxy-L-fuconate hydrolase